MALPTHLGFLEIAYFCAGFDDDASILKTASESRHDRFVFSGQKPVQHFNDRDLATGGVQKTGEFASDSSSPHNHHRFGRPVHFQNLVAVPKFGTMAI